MHINISGKQIDLSNSLKERVTKNLKSITEKYFDHAVNADVTFSKIRSFFTCDINLHTGRNVALRGEGEATDAHSAFDDAAEHIAKRLRRYKNRLMHRLRASYEQVDAMIGHAMTVDPDKFAKSENMNGSSPKTQNELILGVIDKQPVTIAVLSVNEAVMRLDLSNEQVLMFRNNLSKQINVVYRRNDGLVGWLEPTS